MDQALPIIYLRGYAGNQSGVEATVDDPFYGFNAGSTHVRVDERGRSEFFAFESPVIRLMTDHDYRDVFDRGLQPTLDEPGRRKVSPRSIWIYRYYDITSRTFEDSPGQRLEIEQAAEGLRDYIAGIKQLTGAGKVILVGHSTGGLIARCLIQKIYPDDHPGVRMPAFEHIDKVFTYGTPHGGIHFDIPGGDLLAWGRDRLARNNMDDFGRARMHAYLTREGGVSVEQFDVKSLQRTFPAERFFCLVGTNARDYEVAHGLSRTAVGPQSDGLVQIGHAYVRGGPRAYVHRSHSGRYGIVNSEEGYQNLRRFLFGDMRVEICLNNLDRLRDFPTDEGVSHQAEAQVAIRGLPVLMHDQMVAHHSPILLELEKAKEGEPIPLFTVFLIPGLSPDERICRYAVRLGLHRQRRRDGFLVFRDHLEQIPLWSDTLVIDLEQVDAGRYRGTYAWRSEQPDPDKPLGETLTWTGQDGAMRVELDLPGPAREIMGPQAQIIMRASPWS